MTKEETAAYCDRQADSMRDSKQADDHQHERIWRMRAAELRAQVESYSDDSLRTLWRNAGGKFHGPNIETGTMPEDKLLPFLRSLLKGGCVG